MLPLQTLGLAGVQSAASIGNQAISASFQRSLLRQQYEQFVESAARAGASPAAIAQGLTNSGPSSTPSVSAGAPLPDIPSSFVGAHDVESQAALREKEQQNLELEMLWKPKRWFADINVAFSQVAKNMASAGLDRSLIGYYNELKESIIQKRPWEISNLKQGLLLAIQELKNSKQKYINLQTENDMMKSQGRMYDAMGDYYYTSSLNAGQTGFALMFENELRASGWNPSEAPWPNVVRVAATNPSQATKFLDSVVDTLTILDNKAKEGLGEHYKRNALLAAGAYLLYNEAGRHQYNKSVRFDNFTRGVSNLLPMIGGASPNPVLGFMR